VLAVLVVVALVVSAVSAQSRATWCRTQCILLTGIPFARIRLAVSVEITGIVSTVYTAVSATVRVVFLRQVVARYRRVAPALIVDAIVGGYWGSAACLRRAIPRKDIRSSARCIIVIAAYRTVTAVCGVTRLCGRHLAGGAVAVVGHADQTIVITLLACFIAAAARRVIAKLWRTEVVVESSVIASTLLGTAVAP